MIKFEWIKPTFHIFTKGRFVVETLPNGDVHIAMDMDESELNQMAHDILLLGGGWGK